MCLFQFVCYNQIKVWKYWKLVRFLRKNRNRWWIWICVGICAFFVPKANQGQLYPNSSAPDYSYGDINPYITVYGTTIQAYSRTIDRPTQRSLIKQSHFFKQVINWPENVYSLMYCVKENLFIVILLNVLKHHYSVTTNQCIYTRKRTQLGFKWYLLTLTFFTKNS